MEKERQTKIIAIVALVIGVATLTLGFALFGARLVIQSKATVTPDADSFKVVLSKDKDKETIGNVTPFGTGEEATISNTGDPTISNLKANFVNPGEKVVYEFYAVNIGELPAYLNKIEYANVTGQTTNKVCIAGEETTDSYVQSACESIRVTVKVGEDDKACQTSTYATHSLAKETGEKVVVTIEYDKTGARADGPFNVEFGDITLNYSTTDSETKNVPVCTDYETVIVDRIMDIGVRTNIEDNDNDGKISLSDKVTLGTESFYVMSKDEVAGTVTMLSEWNLNVGENTVSGTAGMQNESCKGWEGNEEILNCIITFSSTDYWSSSVSSYPAWVYNDQSNLYIHVENYANKLKEAGYSSVTGRLIKYEELVTLGCAEEGGNEACTDAPMWVKNTSFWTGSANSNNILWNLYTNGFHFNCHEYYFLRYFGVRPVIEISASEI